MAYLSALPNQDRLRVVAADSTALSTQLLVEALARDPNLQVVESASNAQSMLQLLKHERPQVAVVSASFGEDHSAGYELVREIRAQLPATRVVVLLDASERAAVVEAFRAGAHGVFCRTEPFRLLPKCIQCVHRGQVWASSSELHFVLEALAKPAFPNLQTNAGALLSAREMDVVRCVAEGLTNREIAQRLKLTEHTVKNYLFRIFDKLGVSSRVEVVLYALGNGVARTPGTQTGRWSRTPAASPKTAGSVPAPARKTAI